MTKKTNNLSKNNLTNDKVFNPYIYPLQQSKKKNNRDNSNNLLIPNQINIKTIDFVLSNTLWSDIHVLAYLMVGLPTETGL